MSSLKLLTLLLLSQLVALTSSADSVNTCQKVRIALDIGSGSTKIRSGVVDVCTQKLLTQISKDKSPVKFLENLHRDNSDGGFDQNFLTTSVAAISSKLKKVKDGTISKLKNDSTFAQYSTLANSEIEVSGVATEAFRQANNTATFVQMMQKEGVTVHPLTQIEEGRVGFMGVLVDQAADPESFYSWDIGNGSLQIVGYNRGPGQGVWSDFGDRLASNPMVNYILTNFKKVTATTPDGKPVSPNPILPFGDLTQKRILLSAAESFVRSQNPSPADATWAYTHLHSSNPPKVYGIGGVHGGVLDLVRALPNHADAQSYTRKELEIIFNDVLYANDGYMSNKYKVPPQFASVSVSNLILVYSVMKVLGIEEVYAIDVDNTQGTMINPRFWKPTSVQSSKQVTW